MVSRPDSPVWKSKLRLAKELRSRLQDCKAVAVLGPDTGLDGGSQDGISHSYVKDDRDPSYITYKRAVISQKLQETLDAVLSSLNQAVSDVQKCISDLKHAASNISSGLCVVDKQIEIRKGHSEEVGKDVLQQALEHERSSLLGLDNSLGSHMDKGFNILNEMQQLQAQLNDRNMSFHLDRSKCPSSDEANKALGRARCLVVQTQGFCEEARDTIRGLEPKMAKASSKTAACIREAIAKASEEKKIMETEMSKALVALAEAGHELEVLDNHIQRVNINLSMLGTDADAAANPPRRSPALKKLRSRLQRGVFAASSKLQKKESAIADQVQEQIKLFSRYDKNHCGALTEDELRNAIRSALRIPLSDVSDVEIRLLTKTLASPDDGQVRITSLLNFLVDASDKGIMERKSKSLRSNMEQLTGVLWDLRQDLDRATSVLRLEESLLKVTPIKALGLDEIRRRTKSSGKTAASPPRTPEFQRFADKNANPRLETSRVRRVRSAIYDTATTAHVSLTSVFSRFDRSNSGELVWDNVRRCIRRVLMIPPSIVSDADINDFCAALDVSDRGVVKRRDLVECIQREDDPGDFFEPGQGFTQFTFG
jgi:hypothetical protein